jgi:hypothetical protein
MRRQQDWDNAGTADDAGAGEAARLRKKALEEMKKMRKPRPDSDAKSSSEG